jgi:hypothetical protein
MLYMFLLYWDEKNPHAPEEVWEHFVRPRSRSRGAYVLRGDRGRAAATTLRIAMARPSSPTAVR